jgi:hypothetical protein
MIGSCQFCAMIGLPEKPLFPPIALEFTILK